MLCARYSATARVRYVRGVTDGLADPFDTAGVRARVLAAWAASPNRFREDANAEEDYALGGYRDRVVVELAQNAADAAVRGGVPGRLRLTLRDGVLVALNTGAPLDAAGVEALSTLRASSKRGDTSGGGTVGRFGVGFAAVVAVSDSPRIRSATGAVGWSRTRTAELAGAVPALAGEIAARSGHVPVLRLPFADQAPSGAGGAPPEGFVTAVELPLRDDAAVELVSRLLAETGPAVLLALPALTHVEITAGGATRLLTAVHDGDRSRDRPALRVHENFFESGLTMKLLLVGGFYPELSDEARACILGAVDSFHVLFVDGTDIADGVNGYLAQGIMPGETGSDIDSRELKTMDGEQCHFFIVQLQLDGHAFVHFVQDDGALDVADLLAAK